MNSDDVFLIRQLSNLINQGDTVEQALYQIKDVSKSKLWQRVSRKYDDTQNLKDALNLIPSFNLSLISQQLEQAEALGISEADILSKASVSQSRTLQMASLVKGRLIRSASYAATVGLVALVVTAMFAIYVAPMFSDLFKLYPDLSSNLTHRLDGLSFNSWYSVAYYLPPLTLMAFFVYFSLTPTNGILSNNFHRWLPFLKSVQIELTRSYCINNIWEHRKFISHANQQSQLLQQPLFSSSTYKFDRLFNQRERTKIALLFKLNTYENELSIMVTEIETQTIENTNRKTNTLSTILLLLMFFIVANLVYTIYLPIFKLGAVF